jgi:hypothetical protein
MESRRCGENSGALNPGFLRDNDRIILPVISHQVVKV